MEVAAVAALAIIGPVFLLALAKRALRNTRCHSDFPITSHRDLKATIEHDNSQGDAIRCGGFDGLEIRQLLRG